METIWYAKYKPQTLDEIVLPNKIKQKMRQYVDEKSLPHLGLFSKLPGTGKSSLAHTLINEMDAECLWVNASLDRGVDVIRNQITQFITAISITDKPKIVVMDEVDRFSKDGQGAFRGFIDQFSTKATFIFTGNDIENIIQPLLNRLEIYDFQTFSNELAVPMYKRLEYILQQENVEYTKEQLVGVIKTHFPCVRAMISTLNKFSQQGKLELEDSLSDSFCDELCAHIKSHNYEKLKECVYTNPYLHIFPQLAKKLNHKNMLSAVVIINKYAANESRVRDLQLNLLACCAELSNL